MSATAILLPETETIDRDVPLTGRWLNHLCGCGNNCCPGGLAFFLFPPFGNIAALTCVPCLIGQIAARASWRPNICGQHREPSNIPNASQQSNCMRAWLNAFLLVVIPTGYYVLVSWAREWHRSFDKNDSLHTHDVFLWVALGISYPAPIVGIVFMVLTIIFISNFRYWMRQRYNVAPDCCCDCCVMMFCFPCAINQMYAHVYAHKTDCSICSDPGPHPNLPDPTPGASHEKIDFVTPVGQPMVAAATAQPVAMMAQPIKSP